MYITSLNYFPTSNPAHTPASISIFIFIAGFFGFAVVWFQKRCLSYPVTLWEV